MKTLFAIFVLLVLLLLAGTAGAQVGYPIPQYTKTQWEQERDSVIAYRAVMARQQAGLAGLHRGSEYIALDSISVRGARLPIETRYSMEYKVFMLETRVDSLEAKLARAHVVVRHKGTVACDTTWFDISFEPEGKEK